MIVFLVGAGAVDPVEFVAQRQDFELFQQNAELPGVWDEGENVWSDFGAPVFD